MIEVNVDAFNEELEKQKKVLVEVFEQHYSRDPVLIRVLYTLQQYQEALEFLKLS